MAEIQPVNGYLEVFNEGPQLPQNAEIMEGIDLVLPYMSMNNGDAGGARPVIRHVQRIGNCPLSLPINLGDWCSTSDVVSFPNLPNLLKGMCTSSACFKPSFPAPTFLPKDDFISKASNQNKSLTSYSLRLIVTFAQSEEINMSPQV